MKPTEPLVITANDEVQSAQLGERLGAALAPGDIVALCGDLGAGKTTLTRAIARGAGVPEKVPVNSPTFTILNLYDGAQLRICHLDLYRLASAEELEGIGLADLMDERTALVIEWFDLFPDAFDFDHLRIDITNTGPTARAYRLSAGGEASQELLAELK